jgi:hypothetical protein
VLLEFEDVVEGDLRDYGTLRLYKQRTEFIMQGGGKSLPPTDRRTEFCRALVHSLQTKFVVGRFFCDLVMERWLLRFE